jgi:hypothetical protein
MFITTTNRKESTSLTSCLAISFPIIMLQRLFDENVHAFELRDIILVAEIIHRKEESFKEKGRK